MQHIKRGIVVKMIPLFCMLAFYVKHTLYLSKLTCYLGTINLQNNPAKMGQSDPTNYHTNLQRR